MKNKETGEFELVVGNGVLLSGFFIVVLLFAVAFAMGFIVARAKYQQEPAVAAATGNVPVSPPVTSSRPADTPPVTTAPSAAPPTTAPTTQPEGGAPAKQAASETPASNDPASIQQAPPGLYWQVTSIADLQAARVFLQTIKDMGLPATLSPGPNHFTRVLVGPYPDTAAMGRVKTQLENAGMQPVRHNQ